MAINKVIMTGRLTADPELRTTPNGVSVTSFTLALNRGEGQADFFNFVAWRGTAEFVTKYFHKGDGIEVDGHLTARSYEKDGVKRTAYQIICDHVDFPVGKREAKSEGGQATVAATPQYTGMSAPNFEEISDDEDLPF